MNKTIIAMLGMLTIFPAWGKCKLTSKFPTQEIFTLSNGVQIPLPTKAFSFDTVSVFSLIDFDKANEYLSYHRLHPYPIFHKGRKYALGALSSYNYKKTQMGTFREAYFVIISSPRKQTGALKSIFNLLKALRDFPGPPPEDIFFFHAFAFSDHEATKLASEEIWGIKAMLGTISFNRSRKEIRSEVSSGDHKLFRIRIPNKSLHRNPIGSNYNLLATGDNPNGAQLYSLVASCGKSRIALFNPDKHELELFPSELSKFLNWLEFAPVIIEAGRNLEAVQFSPNLF